MFRLAFFVSAFLIYSAPMTSAAQVASATEIEGDFERALNWVCEDVGPQYWAREIVYVRVDRGPKPIVLLSLCGRDEDCEGRKFWENFSIERVIVAPDVFEGQTESAWGRHRFFFAIDRVSSLVHLKLAIGNRRNDSEVICRTTLRKF